MLHRAAETVAAEVWWSSWRADGLQLQEIWWVSTLEQERRFYFQPRGDQYV